MKSSSSRVTDNSQAHNVHQEIIVRDVFWWTSRHLVVLGGVLLGLLLELLLGLLLELLLGLLLGLLLRHDNE